MNALPILARTPETVPTQLVATSASASKDSKGRTVKMVSSKLVNIETCLIFLIQRQLLIGDNSVPLRPPPPPPKKKITNT